jgi:hypothetical protein
VLAAVAVVVAGCLVRPAAPLTSTPGPPLIGRILVLSANRGVWQVSPGTAGARFDRVVDSGEATLSADGRTLAYVSVSGTVLRDTATGTETVLHATAPGTGELRFTGCLRWAPDARRLAARTADGTLYIVGLDGHALVVDRPKQSTYAEGVVPVPSASASPVTVTSEVTCGGWLDANRLLFDRRRELPHDLVVHADPDGHVPPVPADTTTVAIAGPSTVRLIDSDQRLVPLGTCGPKVLTAAHDGFATYLFATPSDDALGRPAALAPTGQLTDGAGGRVTALFIPGSCDVLLLSQALNPNANEPGYRLTRQTAPDKPGPVVYVTNPVRGTPRTAAWYPGTGPAVLVDSSRDLTLRLINIRTGGETTVPLDVAKTGPAVTVLGWLP